MEGEDFIPHGTLPALHFHPQSVLQLVEQDATFSRLQKKIREGEFLQTWQDRLNQEKNPQRLLAQCQALIQDNFIADVVGFQEDGPSDFGLELSFFPGEVVRKLKDLYGDVPAFSADPSPGLPWAVYSYLPLMIGDRCRLILVAAHNRLRGSLTQEDHRILLLASRQLATALLAILRTQELEHRQQALETSHEELSRVLANLKETQGQLVQSEKMAALGSLVAGVAHEINTPLGVSITAASYILNAGTDLQRAFAAGEIRKSDLVNFLNLNQESAELILRNLSRAGDLVQSFKQVAVDQSSQNQRSFKLREYTQEILNSLRPQWKTRPIQMTLTGPEDIPVDSYPGAYAQVVTNLVVNALTHGFEPAQAGTVNLSVAQEAGMAVLIISDNGQGIPPENLPRIFEPFFTTKRGQGGTGLGLHIVYNLVTQVLGGSIQCESTPGSGTRFTLKFPLSAPVKTPKYEF